jgi:hypothetical protein
MKRFAAGMTAAALVAGCAGANSQSADNAEPRGQKIYRTGSNLPVKDDDGSVQVARPDANSAILHSPGASPKSGM